MLPDADPGDFNRDGSITAADIDLLSGRVLSSTVEAIFDLNSDGSVNQFDRTFWVEQLADTHFGDADLNGVVEFDDFAALATFFNQESGWAGGDFDGSGYHRLR